MNWHGLKHWNLKPWLVSLIGLIIHLLDIFFVLFCKVFIAPLKPLDFKYKALFEFKFSTPILEQSLLQAHVQLTDLANVVSSNNIIATNFVNLEHIVLKSKNLFWTNKNMNLKKSSKPIG